MTEISESLQLLSDRLPQKMDIIAMGAAFPKEFIDELKYIHVSNDVADTQEIVEELKKITEELKQINGDEDEKA